MRVAFLTPGFSAAEDDWCIPVLLDLVRRLAEEHELTVFTLRYPHRRRPYEVFGARAVPFGGGEARRLARLPLFVRVVRELVRQSRHSRFDVLHAFWAHEPGFLAAVAGALTRTPVVVSVMGGELVDLPEIGYGGRRSLVNRLLARFALARADQVLVGSEQQRHLALSAGVGDRLELLTLGVDSERFRPGPPVAESPRLEGDPKLLCVASLVPVKDHATLISAFAAVVKRHPGATLHLVGEGELQAILTRKATALGVGGRVRFHGALRHEQLPDLYRQADLCVLSSRSENSALVVLEAAACGCPTVGTAVGLLPDLGSASRTVPAGDAEALASMLCEVLDDAGARAAMAEESLALVRSRLNLERTARTLSALYAELVGA